MKAADDLTLKVDQVTLNDPVFTGIYPSAVQVTFPAAFSTTPVVVVLPDNSDPEPATLRVYDVTTTGFKVFVSEAEGGDGIDYPATTFSYLAMEPGQYDLGGGNRLKIGTISSVTNFQSGVSGGSSWATESFTGLAFAGVPAVITELQTLNSDTSLMNLSDQFTRTTEPFLEVAQRNVSSSDFQYALERAETSAGSIAGETIGYIAMDQGSFAPFTDDNGNSISYEAQVTSDSVTDACTAFSFLGSYAAAPLLVGSMMARDGNNGGWLQLCDGTLSASGLSLRIAEDIANDTEVGHTTETTAFIAYSRDFVEIAGGGGGTPNAIMDTVTISQPTISYSLSETIVSFPTPFASTPLIFPMTTDDELDPALVRVWNISTSGFSIAQTVPEGTTAPASSTPVVVDYIAIEAGDHSLPDGTRLLAGSIDTTSSQGRNVVGATGWDTVGFGTAFSSTPVLVAAANSMNNDLAFDPDNTASPHLAIAVQNLGTASVDLAFELAETSLGSPLLSNETLAYLVAEAGTDTQIGTIGGTTVEFKTALSGNTINGWTNTPCDSVAFPSAFSSGNPLVIATDVTRNGADGGWVRRCSVSAANASFAIDEDQAADSDRGHTTEQVAVFGFGAAFEWVPPLLSHMKLGTIEWDPVNNASNPKAIPGAHQLYTVHVDNLSRLPLDADTVEIVDQVPVNTELFVGDLDGGGCPVDFRDGSGADASGLSFTCASDLLLLTGAPPGGCTPDPDGYCPFSDFSFASDWDSAGITAIKIAPQNAFAGSNGISVPQFEFDFRVRIN